MVSVDQEECLQRTAQNLVRQTLQAVKQEMQYQSISAKGADGEFRVMNCSQELYYPIQFGRSYNRSDKPWNIAYPMELKHVDGSDDKEWSAGSQIPLTEKDLRVTTASLPNAIGAFEYYSSIKPPVSKSPYSEFSLDIRGEGVGAASPTSPSGSCMNTCKPPQSLKKVGKNFDMDFILPKDATARFGFSGYSNQSPLAVYPTSIQETLHQLHPSHLSFLSGSDGSKNVTFGNAYQNMETFMNSLPSYTPSREFIKAHSCNVSTFACGRDKQSSHLSSLATMNQKLVSTSIEHAHYSRVPKLILPGSPDICDPVTPCKRAERYEKRILHSRISSGSYLPRASETALSWWQPLTNPVSYPLPEPRKEVLRRLVSRQDRLDAYMADAILAAQEAAKRDKSKIYQRIRRRARRRLGKVELNNPMLEPDRRRGKSEFAAADSQRYAAKERTGKNAVTQTTDHRYGFEVDSCYTLKPEQTNECIHECKRSHSTGGNNRNTAGMQQPKFLTLNSNSLGSYRSTCKPAQAPSTEYLTRLRNRWESIKLEMDDQGRRRRGKTLTRPSSSDSRTDNRHSRCHILRRRLNALQLKQLERERVLRNARAMVDELMRKQLVQDNNKERCDSVDLESSSINFSRYTAEVNCDSTSTLTSISSPISTDSLLKSEIPHAKRDPSDNNQRRTSYRNEWRWPKQLETFNHRTRHTQKLLEELRVDYNHLAKNVARIEDKAIEVAFSVQRLIEVTKLCRCPTCHQHVHDECTPNSPKRTSSSIIDPAIGPRLQNARETLDILKFGHFCHFQNAHLSTNVRKANMKTNRQPEDSRN